MPREPTIRHIACNHVREVREEDVKYLKGMCKEDIEVFCVYCRKYFSPDEFVCEGVSETVGS